MLLRINVGTDYQEVDADFRVSSAIQTIRTRTYTTSYDLAISGEPIEAVDLSFSAGYQR